MAGEEGRFAPESEDPHEAILKPLRETFDGRIAAFPVGRHGIIVFRPMSGSEVRYYQRKITEASKPEGGESAISERIDFETVELLLRQCVHPTDKSAARSILDDYYRMIPTVVAAINRISGAGVVELGKG
jgi:hypothetical protein